MPVERNTVEATIEESIENQPEGTPNLSIEDITKTYISIKSSVSSATSSLNEKATFNGMDSVSEIVADGMNQINAFIETSQKPSTMSSFKSKTLAVIDPNNKWAGKWVSNTKETLDKEKLKEKTIQEIANQIIAGITKQREDVISYMESVVKIREVVVASKDQYQELLPKAKAALSKTKENTREELDLKSMITRLSKSIMQLDATVTSKINPLIASAHIAIREIDDQLPDIEHDLKYEGSLKVAQQSLSDLIGMAKTIKTMTEDAGDVIRKDIHDTTIESIKMVGDVMLDTERAKRIQLEEQAHMENVNKAMHETADKINKNFHNVQEMHGNYIEHKEKHTSALLVGSLKVGE